MDKTTKELHTIDVTPTWRALIPVMIAVIENGTAEGRKLVISELYRMADIADQAVKDAQDANDDLPPWEDAQ